MPTKYFYPAAVALMLAACSVAQIPNVQTAIALPPDQPISPLTPGTITTQTSVSTPTAAGMSVTSLLASPTTATPAGMPIVASAGQTTLGADLSAPATTVAQPLILDGLAHGFGAVFDPVPVSSSWVGGVSCEGVMYGESRKSPPELGAWLVASEIPQPYWLASCYICLAESWCQPGRTHHNANGSVDYGIMQVNSGNFRPLRALGFNLPDDALDPVKGLNLAWAWAQLVGGDYSRPGQWATLSMARRASWCQFGRIVPGLGFPAAYAC